MQFADRAMRIHVSPSRCIGTLNTVSGGRVVHERDSTALEAMREEHKKSVWRYRLLIKYLRNGIDGHNQKVDAYLDGLTAPDSDSDSREKNLALELLKTHDSNVLLKKEISMLKDQLNQEREEKQAHAPCIQQKLSRV